MTLQFGRRPAKSGQAKSAVIFVHGYGADGRDLLGLAEPLAPHLPDTAFYAPDAPDRCRNNPFGYQWFPIPWMDGSSEVEARTALMRSADLLDSFVDKVLADEGLAPAQLALVGFSQGTMMSLHIAPRRAEPLAGVVGFSGRLLGEEDLPAAIRSRPPVLLIHGDADDVVPPQSMPLAAAALQRAGIDVQTHVSPGTAHGIAPDGLTLALRFLQERL
ncbi:alpha/beta hydrolase [Halodurantibacterium flavum]|uniref:Alpha/beta hydrolase n=1 Tax=Halodurantibacterium flavum TaxID=1382802 RepID=A0ABW4SCI2_9RHOB